MFNLSISSFRLLMLMIIFCHARKGISQDENINGIYFQSKGGFLMAHRSAMTHLVQKNTIGFELGFIKHLQKDQDDRYNFPAIGINLEYRNFGYDMVLGQAISTSYFFNAPLFQKPNFFIDFQYGMGLGYITKKYNLDDNPTNNAIGSHFNAKVTLKVLFTRYFESFGFGGGLEMSHFSNGAITYPNLGLNVPSLVFQFTVLDSKRKCSNFLYSLSEGVSKKNNWLISSIISLKQVRANPNLPKRYPVFGLRGTYNRLSNGKWSWEASLDLLHNESNLFVYPDSTFTRSDVFQIGTYAGAVYRFYQSEIVMGLGYYLRDNISPLGRLYNRIGYRFYATKHWFGLFNIRANLGKADFFEFGLGYRF